MNERNIVIMPGDGIGKVVLPEALRVLDAVGFKPNYIHADIGWDSGARKGILSPNVLLISSRNKGLDYSEPSPQNQKTKL